MSFTPTDARGQAVNPFAGRDVNWLVDMRADSRPDHPFLVWEPFVGERRVWTYRQFRDQTLRIAAGLHKRGVKAGEYVLVHLDNSPELEFLWFACQRIGAIVVTTNTRSSGDELAYFAENCGAVCAITQPELADLVARSCKGIKWLAVTEHLADGSPGNRAAPAGAIIFAAIDGDPADLPKIAADPWRPGSVQYTSGTTSRPKGVLWTHGNALWGARTGAIHENLNETDVHIVMMPSFHTNARTYSILPTLWVGGTAVLMPRFSASRFWDVALRNKCTWASMLPFFCKALMQQPIPKHHFRMFGMNANEQPFDQVFAVRSIGWWGMTETISHGIIGDALIRNRPLSTGRPATGYGIRILREDGVTPVEPGEVGHLQCQGTRGIQMFLEYLGNPQATAESFTADGWFITGDRVRLDVDGTITFSDRDKDMLKVGGENVAASEIERVIATVPGVYENAIVAQKHKMLDEVPVSFVIPAEGFPADQHDELSARVIAECKAKLADFKVPRQVFIVAEMPRSTLEKIHKLELRKRLPVAG
jgi:carnitine-CoA ligase